MLFCQVVFLTMISGFFGLHLTTKSTNRLFMQSSINSKSIAPIYKTDVASLKTQVLLMGAALDRGQAYNPTSGMFSS